MISMIPYPVRLNSLNHAHAWVGGLNHFISRCCRQLRPITGPGNDSTNLRLEKAVKIRESMSAAFQADFYNAFNHANLVGGGAVCTVIDDCNLPSVNAQGVNTGGTFGMFGGSPLQGRVGELVGKVTF